jgi:hypothetical protein
MKVQTRREAVILMTAISLLSTNAVAQPDRLDALFNHPTENLSVPSRVRQRYAILAYYIQLLNLQGPMRSRSEDIAAAIKTYQLVGDSRRPIVTAMRPSRARVQMQRYHATSALS